MKTIDPTLNRFDYIAELDRRYTERRQEKLNELKQKSDDQLIEELSKFTDYERRYPHPT